MDRARDSNSGREAGLVGDAPQASEHSLVGRCLQPVSQELRNLLKTARSHLLITAGVIVNFLLIFPPFYDPNNIPNALAVTTHFNSNVAAFTDQTWVAGPFIDAMYVPGHLAYLVSDYNLYWVYTTFKGIYALLTIVMAYGFYKLFEPKGRGVADKIAAFTLLNPALLFVSYVWVEYDIFPIVFLTLGYLLLRFHPRFGPDSLGVVFPVVLIAISTFFYWYALALVPTLLLFTRTRRQRLNLFVAMVAVFAPLALASIFLLGNNFVHAFGTLTGSVTIVNRGTSFGLHYFIKVSPNLYAGVLIVAVLLLPAFLRSLNFSEYAAGFAVTSLLIYSNTTPQPDNYVLIFPFVVLGYAGAEASMIRLSRLFVALAYPLTGLLLINFRIWDLQPSGVGIFYWGWTIFHLNVSFLHTNAQVLLYQEWFNIATTVALVVGLVVFLLDSRNSSPRGGGAGPPALQMSVGNPSVRRGISRRKKYAISAALGTLIVLSFVFNASLPNLVDYQGTGTAPIYFILPHFVPDNFNVVRPITNATYEATGNSIKIPSAALPIGFSRWFYSEAATFAGSVSVSGSLPRVALVLNGTPFTVGVLNTSGPDASKATAVPPDYTVEAQNASAPLTLLNRTTEGVSLSGTGYLEYNFTDPTFVQSCYTFAFNLTIRGRLQTNIFHLEGPNNFVSLVSYPYKTVLVYAGAASNGTFVPTVVPGIIPTDAWSYASFCATPEGFSVTVNGESASVSVPLFDTGPTQLVLGLPPFAGAINNTFAGFVSQLFVSSQPLPTVESYFATVNAGTGPNDFGLASPEISFDYSSNPSGSSLVVDGRTYAAYSENRSFGVGKFDAGAYAVNITISRFSMMQVRPDNLYLVPVFWTFVAPYLLLVPSIGGLRRLGTRTA